VSRVARWYTFSPPPNLGKFWRILQGKMLVYSMAIWSILLSFGTFCGHLVYFMVIWYIFPVLVYCTKINLATLPVSQGQRGNHVPTFAFDEKNRVILQKNGGANWEYSPLEANLTPRWQSSPLGIKVRP
jgi:hypothetical protein